ncbi:MAG: ATPase, T2SS/T4P/T4SS family, partial [Acidobacteria bacterium]|nr:ATPase, T2SS/T4P/T4SS family [Acidobacteriota bacterium]
MELTIADLKPFLPGLEDALDDEAVSEVMINGPAAVFIERAGRMAALEAPSLTAEAVVRAAVQIARPLGKDPLAEPVIDARLADGSRVAICGPPAAPTPAITIRRFGGRAFTVDELTAGGSLPALVVEQAAGVLASGRNLLISGGTGSGKTTLLNALVSLLPAAGRVISIEDTLELRLRRDNGLRFEARGLGGRGVTIRDLVRHALRHRPDHIVVGEVRGAEAADLLQALNTGHGGSLATVHANNAAAALSRL